MRVAGVLFLCLLVLGLGGGAAMYFIATRQRPPRAEMPVEGTLVEVMRLRARDKRPVVTAYGTVTPAREVTLLPEVSGKLLHLSPHLHAGGLVTKGEVLLRIDPRDYELAVAQARAALTKAEARLRLEQGRQRVARREWKLLEKDLAASPPAENDAGKPLALREPQLLEAEADRQTAESALDEARLRLERTTIQAPFDALVLEESVEIGKAVGPQTPVVTLAGTDAYWVRVSVPVDRLGWLAVPGLGTGDEPAAPATVYQAAGQGPPAAHAGRVERLLGELDPAGRMARLLVTVPDPLGLENPEGERPALPLLLGAYVRVALEGKRSLQVFVVPRRALREGDRVWVMDAKDRLSIREVEVVWRGEEEAWLGLGSPLQSDDRIVVSRLATPLEGMLLRAVETPPPAASESQSSP